MSLYDEMGISDRVKALDEELRALRHRTMDFSYLTSKGTLAVRDCPELDAIQAKIANLEAKLATVEALRSQVSSILDGQGVETIRALRELVEHHKDVIESAPIRAFDTFRQGRELAIEKGNATVRLAMPSEVASLLDGYQATEAALKAAQTASQEALAEIEADMATISGLTNEAQAALRA
jgi:hypothetical protein